MALRRRYSRFLPEDDQVLLTTDADQRYRARVVDESYGGIGVLCEDIAGLEEGLEVEVTLEGAEYDAVIVSIKPSEEDCFHLGLKWIEIEPEEGDDDELSDDE